MVGVLVFTTPSGTAPASALTCAEVTVGEMIARTPVPFIGEVLGEVESESGRIATYQVEESFRVDLPDVVEVHVSDYWRSGEPGLVAKSGAVLAHVTPEGYLAASFGPCEPPVPADLLRSYFEPLPEPTGEGPIAFLVGTELGGARVVALDGQGEILGYGFGSGTAGAVAVCPEERRVVELVMRSVGSGRPDLSLEVRDLVTLESVATPRVIRENAPIGSGISHIASSGPPLPLVSGFRCHSLDGGEVSYLSPWFGRSMLAELHIWSGDEVEVIPAPAARDVVFDAAQETAFLLEGSPPESVTRVTLDSGLKEVFYGIPDWGTHAVMALSPDGGHLAVGVQSAGRGQPGLLVLLDPDGEVRFEVDITGAGSFLGVAWNRERAVLSKGDFRPGITLSFAHPDGWVGRFVQLPAVAAESAVVGDEAILQLGRENIVAVALDDPESQSVHSGPIFPTFGVAVAGSTLVSDEARWRTMGEELPAAGFEPLSAETLDHLKDALTGSSRVESGAATPGESREPAAVTPPAAPSPATDQGGRFPWLLAGPLVVLGAAVVAFGSRLHARQRRTS